jgi:hypothetical protein
MARVQLNELIVRLLAGTPVMPSQNDTVTVKLRDTATNATLYQAATGGTTWPNPLTTSVGKLKPTTGTGAIWVDEGQYDLLLTPAAGGSTVTHQVEAVKGSTNGYAPLNSSGLVAPASLGTGSTGTGSRFLTDASTYVVAGTGGTSNGFYTLAEAGVDANGTIETTEVQAAVNTSTAQGRPLLGVTGSGGRTIVINGTITVANNAAGIDWNNCTLTTNAGSPTFPIINWTETGGGVGRNPNGWMKNVRIAPAAGTVVNGSKGVVINGLIGAVLENVGVSRCFIGIDMIGNPYGHKIYNCWTDPGNCIAGLLVRRGSSSGNDNDYVGNWFGGFRHAVFIEGQSGGFRFRGGQFTGGSGTTSTTAGYGILNLNEGWDDSIGAGTGASIGDVVNVAIDGVSWEGAHDRSCIRSRGKVTATIKNGSNFNLSSNAVPLMHCIWNAADWVDSLVVLEETHIYGYQQASHPFMLAGTTSSTEGGLVDRNNWGVLNVSSARTSTAGTPLADFTISPLGNQSNLGTMPRTSGVPGKQWHNGTLVT